MVVEVAVEVFDFFRGCFDLGDPGFEFFWGVAVVEPGASAVAMPAEVGGVCGEVDFGWEEGFVDDGVGDVVFFEELPGFVAHPGGVAEFDGELEVFGENLEEGF